MCWLQVRDFLLLYEEEDREKDDLFMKRNVDLNEISDGRLYSSGDMVKADCRGCEGCSACCRGMGSSIILDPMDIWRLYRGTGKDLRLSWKRDI